MSDTFVELSNGVWVNPWRVAYVARHPEMPGVTVIGFGAEKELGVSDDADEVVETFNRTIARRNGHRGSGRGFRPTEGGR